MTEQSLTPRDRVVLMALAEEVTNNELQERVGFKLEGADRKRLNDEGLVHTEMDVRPFRHRLTKTGFSWCRRELSAPVPARSTSGTRSLYAVLAGLDRYLQRAGVELDDIFRPLPSDLSDGELATLETRIRTAYSDLAGEPGDWVGLVEVRRQLRGTPREQVDAALLRLSTADGVSIVPDANQGGLTPEDRAAAVVIGGKDRHLITIREP